MLGENEIRVLLSDAEIPPTRVEMGEVLRDGHRTVRRRRMAGVGGAIALAATVTAMVAVPMALRSYGSAQGRAGFAAATGTASPSPSSTNGRTRTCPVEVLPKPDYASVQATTIDPTGHYIGGHAVVGQNFVPIVWTDGVPKVLPIHEKSADVNAVNEHGVAVGLAGSSNEDYVYRYENGKVTKLRTPPGNWHLYPAPAINSAGDIVMNAEPSGSSGGVKSIALIWKAGSDTAVKLPLPKEAGVFAITDDGTIVGGLYKNGVGQSAYTWDQQGHGQKLRAPAGAAALAYAARGDWATGGAWKGDTPTSVLWNLRTGEVRDLKIEGPAQAVNASGWVVTLSTHVDLGGVTAELAAVAPGQGRTAYAIADTGVIAGASYAKDGSSSVPVVWHC